jgi:acetate---CoA ligase (ADP-forming) subunit beta
MQSVAGALLSLGRVLEEQPEIQEIELNPTLSYEDEFIAVDARIIIAKI